MLMFNALIKAQGWLFAAFAALASPPGGETSEQFTDEAAGDVQSQDPAFPLADEVDPSLAARCYDDDEWRKRGHCLAKCDDSWRYRVVSDRMRIDGNNNWCKNRARQFCKRRGDKLDDWCWGDRSGDGGGGWDDDDWDDDDHDGGGDR